MDFRPTQLDQSANLVVQGDPVGSVEVSYREQMPPSDEGPFLKEERKLIETIADRIARPCHAAALEIGIRWPDRRRAGGHGRSDNETGGSCSNFCATPILSCCN